MAGPRARSSDGLPRSEWAFPTPPKPWAEAFSDDVAFLFSKIGARARKLYAEALEPLGLRPNHVAVLQYLHVREGASQREVVDGLWIDASSLVTLLDCRVRSSGGSLRRSPHTSASISTACWRGSPDASCSLGSCRPRVSRASAT